MVTARVIISCLSILISIVALPFVNRFGFAWWNVVTALPILAGVATVAKGASKQSPS